MHFHKLIFSPVSQKRLCFEGKSSLEHESEGKGKTNNSFQQSKEKSHIWKRENPLVPPVSRYLQHHKGINILSFLCNFSKQIGGIKTSKQNYCLNHYT